MFYTSVKDIVYEKLSLFAFIKYNGGRLLRNVMVGNVRLGLNSKVMKYA